MPRNPSIVKAAHLCRSRAKAKLIEWETREYSRGTRDVPVDVSARASQPKLGKKQGKKASRRPRAERNGTDESDPLQGEAAPQSMDVDGSFWVEEPVTPAGEKRVGQPAFPSSMSLTYLLPG
jgi:hypothetical protein